MCSKTFQGVQDRYNGITVDSQEEPCEPNQFLNQLIGKYRNVVIEDTLNLSMFIKKV